MFSCEQEYKDRWFFGRSVLLQIALVQRVPELEAPASPEPRESPESPGPSVAPTDDAGEGQESGSERPWWRRMFGA